mgnify:CR=1 FL=1
MILHEFKRLCRSLIPRTVEYLGEENDLLKKFMASPTGRSKAHIQNLMTLFGYIYASDITIIDESMRYAIVEELYRRHFSYLYHGTSENVVNEHLQSLLYDKDIPVITSKQIASGINYSKKGWLLSLEAYYKKVKGITTQSQGFQNQYEFVKATGNYDSKGFDLLIRKNINKLNTWLSYSYLDSRYEFNSLENSSFPSNYNINHSITLGSTYNTKKIKLSAGFNWHSGKPTTRPIIGNEIVDNEINFAGTNEFDLKDYFRVDVSALYNFKLGKNDASIGVSIWNVLDRENEINNF